MSKRVPVHTLVAEAFVDGRFDGAEVNHKDFDRTNNKAENLEWVSHHDNIAYTIAHERHVSQRNLTGKNNPNYGNTALSAKYASDAEYAKVKQGRPGVKNGRTIPVRLYVHGESLDFGYIAECADYLIKNNMIRAKCIVGTSTNISRAARNGKKYCGFTFELI